MKNIQANCQPEHIASKRQAVINDLQERINELKKILPEYVFDFNEFYFAGGCIYSLWNEKNPKDYDIFCKRAATVSKLKAYFKTNKDKANIITGNAITVGKFQFITKYVGNPEKEVGKFDFKHNMFYYDNTGLHALADWKYLSSNKLVFNSQRARDIFHTIARIPKFVERGMEISQAEIYDILEKGTRPTKIFGERRSIKRSKRYRSGY